MVQKSNVIQAEKKVLRCKGPRPRLGRGSVIPKVNLEGRVDPGVEKKDATLYSVHKYFPLILSRR